VVNVPPARLAQGLDLFREMEAQPGGRFEEELWLPRALEAPNLS
jgi:hypothetical protein